VGQLPGSGNAVTRTIQFWRITKRNGDVLPGLFPTNEFLVRVNALTGDTIYAIVAEDIRLLAKEVEREKLERRHLILCRVRPDNLPALEEGGTIDDLKLKRTQNLAEETHMVFLPNNVIGVIFNRDGPRAGRLADYGLTQFNIDFGLRPVIDRDTAKALAEMGTVTSVDFRIPTSRASLLPTSTNNSADVLNAFKSLAEVSDSRTVEFKVVLSTKSSSASSKWRSLLFGLVNTNEIDQFDKFKIHAKSNVPGSPSIIKDFVEERLVLKREIALDSSIVRRLNPASAYQAILDAYSEAQAAINLVVANETANLTLAHLNLPADGA